MGKTAAAPSVPADHAARRYGRVHAGCRDRQDGHVHQGQLGTQPHHMAATVPGRRTGAVRLVIAKPAPRENQHQLADFVAGDDDILRTVRVRFGRCDHCHSSTLFRLHRDQQLPEPSRPCHQLHGGFTVGSYTYDVITTPYPYGLSPLSYYNNQIAI